MFVNFNIFAHNLKTNRDRNFVFVAKKGFVGMPNRVVILPMMSNSKWPTGRHFVRIFNIFAHNLKTYRDRDFVFVSNKGYFGMPNLVVIVLMMSDSKWPTGGHFVWHF